MEVPRPDVPFCKAGFRGSVQANHFRAIMAFHTANFYHHNVPACIWKNCQHTHGWDKACFILYERDHHLELFCFLSHRHIQYLRSQRRDFWKSIFSKAGDSIVHSYVQPCQIRYPVIIINISFYFLCIQWYAGSP